MLQPRIALISCLLLMFSGFAAAGEDAAKTKPPRPCDLPEGAQFDFWLGEWDVTWTDAKGQTQKGSNRIHKILGSCIVEENFSGGGFEGRSWSVYNPQTKKWQQTWVDSTGGYMVFTGTFADGKMELRMAPVKTKDGKNLVRRMVFRNIDKNGFTWDWQSSVDDGKTWKDLWVLTYSRKTAS